MRRTSGRQPLAFARGPRDRHRPGGVARAGRKLLASAIVAVILAIAALLAWGGSGRPTAALAQPLEVVGRDTSGAVVLRAGRAGLRSYEVRLEAGDRAVPIAAGEVPATGLLGNGVREKRVDLTIDAGAAGLPEGDARLVVEADDHAPLSWLRGRGEVLSVPVRIDVTPPKIALLSGQQRAVVGGSAIAVYTVTPDTVRSGVEVGPVFFPGRAGAFPDPATHAALFAIPHDEDPKVIPKLVAEDAAGNRREIPVGAIIKPKRFPSEEIALGEPFVNVKIPELIAQNQLPANSDPVAAFLSVNRDLRRTTEERLRQLTRDSSPRFLFEEAFRQQPGTEVGSRFAERRTYRYQGRVIDEQTHLGTDLASVKQDPVVAANTGSVIFVGDLGIYGQAIVLDHGLGLESLYAHLSQANVSVGQSVARGDVIGRTGETGLAAGDHLHFSIMIDGVHVDPVEWWDGKWIRDHIAPELAAATPPATAATGAAQAGAPAEAAGTAAAATGLAAPATSPTTAEGAVAATAATPLPQATPAGTARAR